MGAFYKEMYNFEKVKEYVESEIPDIVNLIITIDEQSTISSSLTFTEIQTALRAHKIIIAHYFDEVDNYAYQLSQITQEGTLGADIHVSGSVYADTSGFFIDDFVFKSDGTITHKGHIT